MVDIGKGIVYSMATAGAALVLYAIGGRTIESFFTPTHIWAPEVVESIQPYENTGNKHLTQRGFEVSFEDGLGRVDFPRKNWDSSIAVGDTVEVLTRKSLNWFGKFPNEFDGLEVKIYDRGSGIGFTYED